MSRDVATQHPAKWSLVKLGGSLLDLPDMPQRLDRLAERLEQPLILITGGGRLADEIRRLDAIHRLSEIQAHRLALGSMSVSARLVAELWPAATFRDSVEDQKAALVRLHSPAPLERSPHPVEVWDVAEILAETLAGNSFPHIVCDWTLTSDSIAAILAQAWSADRLVLLKSAPPPTPELSDVWSQSGYVDPQFARLAEGLKLEVVDLRGE